ncbi:P44/Msp2 family outer membrane protein [Wolbachia endosymbiont of Folsomia candida]|uniref:P44/Msp2 family outer membrane protein n=1 Tax=Wolbachia endosymbiont of Folsomia candida TaxID=169402 RepID=UPI000A84008F|nr:P44/Msp2 family outer membrane protein [Wolbachia endosymbiont of Folsomia candida]APR98739.1 hypothetical protein ASM33_05880 [Wolbachia endosymbiont of Folsomia candida]
MYARFILFTAFSLCFLLSTVCFSNERFESIGKGFYTRFAVGRAISNNFQDAVKTQANTVHAGLSVAKGALTGNTISVLKALGEEIAGISNSNLEADFQFLYSSSWGIYNSNRYFTERYEIEMVLNKIKLFDGTKFYDRNMVSLMSNIYYEPVIKSIPLIPYFGFGGGLVAMKRDSDFLLTDIIADYRLAIQIKLGVNYSIASSLESPKISVGYCYFSSIPPFGEDDLKLHNIEVGFIRSF